MKIAVMGDFHFGYDRFYDDSFIQAERALLKAQELADLIIIAGDVFDSRVPKPEVMAKAFEIFSKIGKKIIVIHGTHERRPKGFATPIDLLCKAGFAESCHLRYALYEAGGRKIAVYGMGGVPEEYAKAAIDRIAPKPVEGAFNVFMFHQNLKELMPVVEHGLYMDDLPQGFDLYVDGHLHKNYDIEKNGKRLLVPGSTVLTQLRKEESMKGFYLFEVEEGKADYIAIDARPFFHCTLKWNGEDSLKQLLSNKISEIDLSKKPIIRIDVEGSMQGQAAAAEINSVKSLYAERCHLHINASLDEGSINLENLEFSKSNAVSIREKGMIMLKEIAKRGNLAVENIEEAFDIACEADEEELREYFIRVSTQKE